MEGIFLRRAKVLLQCLSYRRVSDTTATNDLSRPKRKSPNGICRMNSCLCWKRWRRRVRLLLWYQLGALTSSAFTPGYLTSLRQPALIAPPASDANGSQTQPNGNELAVGAHTGGLPLASSSILPARPNLPDDPVIPHNGFSTLEEGEKAFTHLLRKAGVDANWTWDQTMRAIITDPLYKALNSLAEKKSVFEKVGLFIISDHLFP